MFNLEAERKISMLRVKTDDSKMNTATSYTNNDEDFSTSKRIMILGQQRILVPETQY
jgi:hypothetical protein